MVENGSKRRERTFSGAAKAGVETKISFKVGGTISRLPVRVGDVIQEGDELSTIDPRDYELQVEDVRASLAQARAQRRNAAADYDRVRGLYENNNASKADLDAARTAAESAEAAVRSMEKKLELAQRQLEYTRLLAPVDGLVAEVPVDVNENVTSGQTILTVNSGARPEVEVAVPESLITQVRRGSQVAVAFDALSGQDYSAEVLEVGVSPTRSATTFPVTVRLNQPNPKVLPGMAAEVTFRFHTGEGGARVVVPPQSVGEDRQGKHVFTLERTGAGLGTVHRRTVRIGELVSEGLEIVEGLSHGDLVVTAGVSQIAEGQQVRLLDGDRL